MSDIAAPKHDAATVSALDLSGNAAAAVNVAHHSEGVIEVIVYVGKQVRLVGSVLALGHLAVGTR